LTTKKNELATVGQELQLMGKEGSRWKIAAVDLVQQIDQTLGSGAADEELCSGFHLSLRHQDFWSLCNGQWLNDQVS